MKLFSPRRFRVALAGLISLALVAVALPVSASAAPLPDGDKAAVYGVVTPQAGGTWDGPVRVWLEQKSPVLTSKYYDPNSSGYFEFNNVPVGQYTLLFQYLGSAGWTNSPWPPPGGIQGDQFVLAAGQVLEANGTVYRAATVSGTISAPSGVSLVTPRVELRNVTTSQWSYYNANASTGGYSFAVAPGRYEVWFNDPESPILDRVQRAGTVNIGYGDAAAGIDGTLGTFTSFSGTLSYELPGGGTAPLAGATVSMVNTGYSIPMYGTSTTTTDANGRWVLSRKLSESLYGNLRLSFASDNRDLNLLGKPWNDGDIIVADTQAYTSGFDAVLQRGSSISGRMIDESGHPVSNGFVSVYDMDDPDAQWLPNIYGTVDSSGNFWIGHLEPGTYMLELTDGSQARSYYDETVLKSDADLITLATKQDLALGDVVFLDPDPEAERLAGANRFATNVEISKATFPDGAHVPVVYIASGLGYPDALSAGPAAIHRGGGLLLVLPTEIPQVVATELARLNPDEVVIVGSTATISASVQQQLAQDYTVRRIGGANRYETSVAIVKDAFKAGQWTEGEAMFATGTNFPDALSAGPAAGFLDIPIILVNGLSNEISPSTTQLIRSLDIKRANFLGSELSLSRDVAVAVLNAMKIEYPDATWARYEGANRYETAYRVNQLISGTQLPADTAYLASGAGFADALAGGPLAGSRGERLYLAQPGCVPAAVLEEFYLSDVNRVVLFGSSLTLSTAVEDLVPCP